MFQKVTRLCRGLLGKTGVFAIPHGQGALDQKVQALRQLFGVLDAEIARGRRQLALNCPEQCGHCCENARVETTELEMLPLAYHLVQAGLAEPFYAAADRQDFAGRCVFYEPDTDRKGCGRCLRYDLRPLICRLFAFSGNADKYGRPRLIVCGIIKETTPQPAAQAAALVERGEVRPPLMADYVMQAAMIDPELAREQLPINLAFKRAVDRVWLHRQFHRSKT